MEAERERVDNLDFTAKQRKNLHKVIDLFEEAKFEEAYDFISAWGRCPRNEVPEAEYVNEPMYTIIMKGSLGSLANQELFS
jgi:hypothetical protein